MSATPIALLRSYHTGETFCAVTAATHGRSLLHDPAHEQERIRLQISEEAPQRALTQRAEALDIEIGAEFAAHGRHRALAHH